MGLKLIEEGARTDGLFSLDELKEAMFSNRVLFGEQLTEELVERCEANPTAELLVDGASQTEGADHPETINKSEL